MRRGASEQRRALKPLGTGVARNWPHLLSKLPPEQD